MHTRPALGPTQSPIWWVPGVKRPGREADHLPPSDAEVKNVGIYTYTTPCVFTTWCLTKQRIRLHDVVLS